MPTRQMALKADYWDCSLTVDACCAQLRKALPNSTADDLTKMFTMLPEQVGLVPWSALC